MRAGVLTAAAMLCVGLAQAGAAEMTFATATNGGSCVGCSWISAQGEITLKSHEKLRAFFNGKGIDDVYLDSEGGSVEGAIELGRAFRELRVSTHVGQTLSQPGEWRKDLKAGHCLGACALAFAGGVTRGIGYKASRLERLAFGVSASSYTAETMPQHAAVDGQARLDGKILAYVLDMGLDPRALLPNAKNAQVYSADEMTAFRIIWNPPMLSEWRVEPFQWGLAAVSQGGDGNPSLRLYCEGRRKKLLYSLRKPAEMLVIGYQENWPYHFAGAEIPVEKIDFQPTDTLWRAYLTLPDAFIPTVSGEEDALSNANDNPPGQETSISFSTKGLANAARIAFKNCL